MPIDATTASLIGAAIGAFAGVGGSIFTNYFNNRSQERRHLKDTAVKLAMDNWNMSAEVARNLGGDLLPLDLFLIHSMKLTELASDPSVSPDNIRQRLQKLYKLVDAASAEITTQNKEKTEQDAAANP